MGLLNLYSPQCLHHMPLLYSNTFENLDQTVNLKQFSSFKTLFRLKAKIKNIIVKVTY